MTSATTSQYSKSTRVTAATSSTAASRLSKYNSRSEMARKAERDRAAAIVPALAARSYHLPGNTWRQDWWQYFKNNHPVLGLCCHDRLHPIGTCKRVIVLVGSIASGLAITNLLYLYFLSTDEGLAGEFASFNFNANVTVANTDLAVTEVTFTYYQITLWTVGTSLHSLFDLSVWFIAACGCCQAGGSLECLGGRCSWMGSYIVLFAVVIVAATASFIVVLRATLEDQDLDVSALNATAGALNGDLQFTVKPEAYRFLISWGIELVLALFVYYFVLGTILFSGVLGCGRLPFLGGRPRELYLEEKQEAKRKRRGTAASRRDPELGQDSVIPIN